MGLFGQSLPTDGARERFAQLHFQAACVRMEMLSRILREIDEQGGVEHVPAALVNEAASAATEVAENLRWAQERMRQSDLQRAEEAAADGFSVWQRRARGAADGAGRRAAGRRSRGSAEECEWLRLEQVLLRYQVASRCSAPPTKAPGPFGPVGLFLREK